MSDSYDRLDNKPLPIGMSLNFPSYISPLLNFFQSLLCSQTVPLFCFYLSFCGL